VVDGVAVTGLVDDAGSSFDVSSTVTTHCGFSAMLRALRAFGEHENQNRSVSGSQTPHTGIACGRADADAVTTQ
jgi:hypothetical protein